MRVGSRSLSPPCGFRGLRSRRCANRSAEKYFRSAALASCSDRTSKLAPPGLKPLLRLRECRDWNCFTLGIVARPAYRNSATREINPSGMHSMSRDLHIALEQANFAFARQRKTLRPAHFHAPGRTSVVKAVLDIDRQLAEIDRSFDLLLQATPVNAESAWREFRRSRFEKPPVFYYRPLAVDPVLLKRQLYLIPVERDRRSDAFVLVSPEAG